MQLLEGTLVATFLLIPGYFSLALALSPRSRAIRQTSLGTRVFGLLVFAAVHWFLALLIYDILPVGSAHYKNLATLLVGSSEPRRADILAEMLGLPWPLLAGMGLMVAVSLATGGICAMLHHAALTGCAMRNYSLQPPRLICGRLPWRTRAWFWISTKVDELLHWVRLSDLFQPLGAGYWLVLRKAAQILQITPAAQQKLRSRGKDASPAVLAQSRSGEKKVARVYADLVQGDEFGSGGRVGVLYSGTVKHLVCETDGNVVYVLLTEAKRWPQGRPASEGANVRGKPIDNSMALGLDGRSIRNISFRLIEKSPIEIAEGDWPKPA
jgi:hypothetical protein